MQRFIQTVLVLAATLNAYFSAANDSPIIAIFSQPTTNTNKDCGGNCLYIAASYVKYIEAAGARVVPVNYYATTAELDELFPKVNGWFFPGGSSGFPSSAQHIYDKVVQANKNGVYTPLWGTCMGFQWLLLAQSRDSNILDPSSGQMDAYNYSIPLEFTSRAQSSRMFSGASVDLMKIYASENVTMNNHHYGMWTEHFKSTPSVSEFFDLLSVNNDRNGKEFISTIEAFDMPIYGSQWHPEKNPFEWQRSEDGTWSEAINHSANAILAAQYPANFFVNEARKSQTSFPTAAEEDAALIYNYPKTKTTGSFVETYFFHFKN